MQAIQRCVVLFVLLISLGGAFNGQTESSPQAPMAQPLDQSAGLPAAPEGTVEGTIPTNLERQPAGAKQNPTVTQMVWDVAFPVLLLAAPLLSFLILRTICAHLVVSFMMRKAPTRSTFETTDAPATPFAANDDELQILEINKTNGLLLNGTAQGRLERAFGFGRRTLKGFAVTLAAGACGVILSASIEALMAANRPIAGMFLLVGFVAYVLILLAGLYLYPYLRRLPLWIGVFASVAMFCAGVLAWNLTKIPIYLTVLPSVAQGIVAWLFIRKERMKIKAAGNKRLLILRVFGSDKSTAFTFGSLMERWRYVGSYFTIADPSYVRFQFSAINPFNHRNVGASAVLYFLAAGLLGLVGAAVIRTFPQILPEAFGEMSAKDQLNLLTNSGHVFMIPLAIFPMFYYIKRKFATSQAEAEQHIEKAIERGNSARSGIFHGIPMFCFDDVWKPAVRRMLGRSDAVLMDLRGFSAERKGCAYEIGELIDHFAVERLLLLVTDNSEKQELYSLIRRRWASMSQESPNMGHACRIKVYLTPSKLKPRQARKDIERLVGLMSVCTEESAAQSQKLESMVHFA